MDERLKREIEHGKYLSTHGAGEIWNWTSPAGKLRWKRRVKMLTEHLTAGMKVLELGCGTGFFTREIVKTGAQVTAIDVSPELLTQAGREVTAENVVFKVDNAYEMSFNDDEFDSVIGSSVLHHLDIDRALAEIFRVLKRGGKACFTEPNMLHPQIALQKNIPWLKRKLGDSPDETAFVSCSLRRKLREFGFSQIEIKPFDFLHPAIPGTLLPVLKPLCDLAEKIPVLSLFAGSLCISFLNQNKQERL